MIGEQVYGMRSVLE